MDLQIETRQERDTAHVRLRGEFDLAGIERFERAIEAVEAQQPATIVVDLGELQFMDSSGLRALVMAHERALKAGRRLAIIPGPPVIRRVFEITQLDSRLDLVDDVG